MDSIQKCKLLILLTFITSTVQGQLYTAISFRNGLYKIENVFDSNFKKALGSIGQNAWNANHLDLSSNALSKIDSSDLSQFANLKVLNLSLNVLSETVDLSQLQQLQTLDLNNNYIQRVRVGRSVQNLRVLQLKEQVKTAVEELLRSTANSLGISFQNSLQALQDIVGKYDSMYQAEEENQRSSKTEQHEHEQQISRLQVEKEGLEKTNVDVDALIQKANKTLADLSMKDKSLSNLAIGQN
uniref:Uncharacterized protein n=1 Tax=Anopheles atroparvus TaxID=41427 RepID=A0A8W7NZC7_ANOAO